MAPAAGRLLGRSGLDLGHRRGRRRGLRHRRHRVRQRPELGPHADRVRVLRGRQPPHLRGAAGHRPHHPRALPRAGDRTARRHRRGHLVVHPALRRDVARRQAGHRRRRGVHLRPDTRHQDPDPRSRVLRRLAEGGQEDRGQHRRPGARLSLPGRAVPAHPGEDPAQAHPRQVRCLEGPRHRPARGGRRLGTVQDDGQPAAVEHLLRGVRGLQRPAQGQLQEDELAVHRGRRPPGREDLRRERLRADLRQHPLRQREAVGAGRPHRRGRGRHEPHVPALQHRAGALRRRTCARRCTTPSTPTR